MKGEYKIAVLVDVPNTQELDYDDVQETIEEYGTIDIYEAFFQSHSGIQFIEALEYKGFETIVVENLKDVDTTLVARGSEIICSERYRDIDLVTIVSGDSDYLPLVYQARDYRKKTLVIACNNNSFSPKLRESADYSEALETRFGNDYNRTTGGFGRTVYAASELVFRDDDDRIDSERAKIRTTVIPIQPITQTIRTTK